MTELLVPDWQVLIYIVPVMVFSGLVHGALGLGFPMVATPIIAIFLDVKLAILITLLPTTFVNVASIYSNASLRSTMERYYPLLLACAIGALIGAGVLSVADASPFRLLLAALILLFLFVGQSDYLPRQWIADNRVIALLLVGIVGGFSGGTTNVMVAVLLIYFLSMEIGRAEMVSAMNLCFLLGKLAQIMVFLHAGLLGVEFIVSTVPLAVCALVSLYVGQRVGGDIPQERYRNFLKGVLACLAVVLIWQFFSGL